MMMKNKLTKGKLEKLYYEEYMTCVEIGKMFNVSYNCIFKLMKKYNLKLRKPIKRKKKKYHRIGYVFVIDKSHPRKDDRNRVYEHIVIMEKKIGRYLKYYLLGNKNNEVVHHINLNKIDNRIENLQLMTNSQHIKLHKVQNDKEETN